MRFVWSLTGIVIGIILVWKTYPLVQILGKADWAERYFGAGLGGTYFVVKASGIILIILSAMYMFGILDNLLSPFANIFGGLRDQ